MLFFNWLRSAAKAAILAGVGDAVAELSTGTAEDSQAAEALGRLLSEPAAIEAPADDANKVGRRSGRLNGVAPK